MILRISLISALSALFGLVSCYVGSPINMSCENGVCSRKEDQGSCVVTDDEQRLFRWDPVKVKSVNDEVLAVYGEKKNKVFKLLYWLNRRLTYTLI